VKVIVFGIGQRSERLIRYLVSTEHEVLALSDNNPNRWGGYIDGIEMVSPKQLVLYDFDKIVISTNIYYKEIHDQLNKALGIPDDKILHSTYFSAQNLLNYYADNPQGVNPEMYKSLENIRRNNSLKVFNDFVPADVDIEVYYDEEKTLYYAIYCGKRMYLNRNFNTEDMARRYCQGLLQEQDINSPHRYLDEQFGVSSGSVVVDAGVAEGNFGLEIIDRVKHLYLIECDELWKEALEYTFEPYKDKVTIVSKYLSDEVSDTSTTIDEISRSTDVDFIKMDIEGMEFAALKGGAEYLRLNKNIKVVACAYHNFDDEIKIKSILQEYGFEVSTTKGYMVFMWSEMEPKKLVRGLVRGEKKGN